MSPPAHGMTCDLLTGVGSIGSGVFPKLPPAGHVGPLGHAAEMMQQGLTQQVMWKRYAITLFGH